MVREADVLIVGGGFAGLSCFRRVDCWVSREEVIETFKIKRTRFYELVKEKKWPTLRIGKEVLVKVKKLVQSARNRSLSFT